MRYQRTLFVAQRLLLLLNCRSPLLAKATFCLKKTSILTGMNKKKSCLTTFQTGAQWMVSVDQIMQTRSAYMGINLGCGDIGMPKQHLYST